MDSRLSELNTRILYFQHLIPSLSKSHPLCVPSIGALAETRFDRYELSKQQDDLNQSIIGYTEAIFLLLPLHDHSPNIVHTFWSLTHALVLRVLDFEQPEDVECCINFLQYIQDQLPGVFPDVATSFLVHALAVKMGLKLGDLRGDIDSQKHVSLVLKELVHARFGKWSRWEEKKTIRCLREASMRISDFHLASVTVAYSLFQRFQGTGSVDYYEEGMAILDGVISFRAPGGTPSPYQDTASRLVADFAMHRFRESGKPDDLEEAIYRLRSYLDVISPDDPRRPSSSGLLSLLQNARGFDQVGVRGSVRNVHSSNLESPSHPSFQDLTTSLTQSNVDTFSMTEHMCALSSAITSDLTDISEIEDFVKYCRQLLASPRSGQLWNSASYGVGLAFFRAFECTNRIEYLNDAIPVLRDCYSNPSPHGARTFGVQTLITCLSSRFRLLRHGEDSNELMQLFPIALNDISAAIPNRFTVSCDWARLARSSQHPSTPTAYHYAISLMQASLTFSPTLHTQHLRLVAMRNGCEKLPLDYASYLIDRGQLEKAVETLERGRALMWSEMRGFRTSIEKIRTADLNLADKFAAVNQELEMLTLTSSNDLYDGGDGSKRMGPYGDLVVRQQRLLDDRDKLISHIQTIPGFENFLEPLSSETLRSAARRGPIIIVNHCAWRSDIIILLPDSPPSLISTSDDFYGRANKLRDQLLDTRRKGLESKEYEDTLNSVLEGLYELVGRPVIKRLNELHIAEQSRVWWCPTSAFCSLPLHAMGPIPSDVGPPKYFLDLYIPSYTPTISALIESNKPSSETLEKPSILLALQPDEFMTQALNEMRVVQAAETRVTTLISERATPNAVLERLRDHRFVHIVCHGTLETGKPFDASFRLHAGVRLSLLNIVESQLPDAEFAFLSACHTAELTEESLADEGLHLTAAMQYCGFRSVVGTMWAMADTDGQDLARNFYKSVFSGRRQGVRHYERTAEALRDAVQRLRRKRGITLERWVNFVHYGA